MLARASTRPYRWTAPGDDTFHGGRGAVLPNGLPLGLTVPGDRFRQRTPKCKTRSARLLGGSTPCCARKTQSESISCNRWRANRPTPSAWSCYWSINIHSRAYHACLSLPDGRGFGHMAKPLELRQRPGATRREGRLTPFCQAPGCMDQVGQVCLSMFDPGLVHTVAVTD